jgi:DNA-binding HxlR family transcriptional regulator
MAKTYDQACPIARTLEIVGERWTLLIVRELFRHGSRRFQDLQGALAGVAPNVLSDRLKTLEEHRLIRREFYSKHPPRAAYVLTPLGRELQPALRALAVWGAKHLGGEVQVLHEACGHSVEMRTYCPHCEAQADAVKVTWPADLQETRPAAPQRRAR